MLSQVFAHSFALKVRACVRTVLICQRIRGRFFFSTSNFIEELFLENKVILSHGLLLSWPY